MNMWIKKKKSYLILDLFIEKQGGLFICFIPKKLIKH